jgi:hypothetical protein
MMEVALALSSQKPGLSESCLSFSILALRFSTSKKPPYPGNAGPHIIQFFDCHGAKINELKVYQFENLRMSANLQIFKSSNHSYLTLSIN